MTTTQCNRRQRRERDVTALMEGRYAPRARQLLAQYGVRVCHWRNDMTGIAWIGHPRKCQT